MKTQPTHTPTPENEYGESKEIALHKQHTPMPWNKKGTIIYDANDFAVAHCDTSLHVLSQHANAAYIVRAVNHHQELIGMLRCVREALAKNVYETGQPGTWATKIDDAIVDQIARAEGR